jgi:hypothetical protein
MRRYEICFVEDVGFYELARPTFDVPTAALAPADFTEVVLSSRHECDV